jgi:hypothetical protein
MTGSGRTPAPAPPWHVVIATTVKLWWQRRASPATESRRRTQALRIIVSLLVLALVAVSATAIRLAQTHATATPRSSRTAAHGGGAARPVRDTAALAAAAATRQQAAAWIASQVGRNVIVACDPAMCTALQQHDFPAANLSPVGPGAGDPLGSGIVVSTMAVRNALGARLTSVYAPAIIASFGTGQGLVQVLATAPDGAAAYAAAEQADLLTRQSAGRELLRNRNLQLSATAASQLAAGQVDSRLLITLGALTRLPVSVVSFGDAGPGAARGVPLREMAIRSTGPRYLQGLLAFLRAQRAPLLALTSVSHAGKTMILHVEFTAPSPTGLVIKT